MTCIYTVKANELGSFADQCFSNWIESRGSKINDHECNIMMIISFLREQEKWKLATKHEY